VTKPLLLWTGCFMLKLESQEEPRTAC